ncbi:hypothetical protein N5F23_00580 [Pseudomonas sichuanensis]|uniref:hypothetical protein n=1 Tax=Pseudomonas sichuanensis TaxID=2213015 RepID=UPI00244959CD|nr:hypothetical protein [Pseudomonas sichuanensis]MDH0730935.1 hypothetical protein [Pseudomonas sichuanensis]MDH1581088.1 hypothetical protein [Pseudomonas sichuanensis]MDH1591051.1 hypothetical protein [Pseudomonas sichuanensis]MDH1596720.1 hypothetical protein [Pseudomonas sichuanensis]
MREEKVVMYESPEAASIQTVAGWVDPSGRFWGKDEHMARYCGSTHRHCAKNPGHPIHATNGWCEDCRAESRTAKFEAMPKRVWGGEVITEYDGDQYFFDEEDLRDYLIEHEVDLADLKLVFCTPNYPRQIDPNDHFCDDLPEDGEVNDDQLLAAFELLNEMIKNSPPLSWSPDNEAVELPQAFVDMIEKGRQEALE